MKLKQPNKCANKASPLIMQTCIYMFGVCFVHKEIWTEQKLDPVNP